MEAAQLRGLDIQEALRDARITEEIIGQDATRVTPAQATRLVQALWNATDDELFGVGPKAVPRGTFRMMALGVIHTPDLRTALQRLVEFTRIATGFEAVEMTEDDRIARLSFDPGGRTRTDPLLIDIIMAVIHRFASWLIGRRIILGSVDLPGVAPPHAAEYLLFYGVAPVFEAPTAAITFDSRYLSAPVMRTEDELTEFIRRSPTQLLFRQDYNPTTSSRVRKIIERRRSDEAVTVEDIARAAHRSARSTSGDCCARRAPHFGRSKKRSCVTRRSPAWCAAARQSRNCRSVLGSPSPAHSDVRSGVGPAAHRAHIAR